MQKIQFWVALLFFISLPMAHGMDADIVRAVWAHQAVIATYHYDYQNYTEKQKKIARFFSAKAWINYTKALHEAGMPEKVKNNQWTVRAVAMRPPTLKSLPGKHWQAQIPILVEYSSEEKVQLQTLMVQLQFGPVPRDTGVDGYAIDSYQAKIIQKPCECALTQAKANIIQLK